MRLTYFPLEVVVRKLLGNTKQRLPLPRMKRGIMLLRFGNGIMSGILGHNMHARMLPNGRVQAYQPKTKISKKTVDTQMLKAIEPQNKIKSYSCVWLFVSSISLRCLASFLLWEGCSIILDTDIVVTELRLSSDNALFRFPYLFIYNHFNFDMLIYSIVPYLCLC